MSKKILFTSVLCLLLSTILLSTTTIYADDNSKSGTGFRYHYDDDRANWVKSGGLNKFDGVKAENREETKAIEDKLYAENYILCTTDDKEITDEELSILRTGAFWFNTYLKEDSVHWDTDKVYIYKPTFEDFIEQYYEGGGYELYTNIEMNNSTVVLRYFVWDELELAGSESDLINDNLPDDCKSGYLEIRSNVNCEVKIMQSSTRRYHTFYVKKNEPFLVKILSDCYHIVGVNKTDIPDNIDNNGEDTLPYNNQLQILPHNTIDNPYVLELYELNSKYKIKDIDIDGKPDYNLLTEEREYSIPVDEKSTIIEEDTDEETLQENEPITITPLTILLIILIALIILWGVAVWLKNKSKEPKE